MTKSNYHTDDIIAALATPWATSALALIRTSGAGSVERLSSLFHPPEKLARAAGNTVVHGTLIDPETREKLDEVIALVFRAPASYTGEDSVEITCHGSLPGIGAILQLMRKIGFRDAEPGEFTLRAFLNGKMDLTEAEAVREIVESKSRKAHIMALGRLSGSILHRIEEVKQRLLSITGGIEISLDYPDDELDDDPNVDLEKLSRVISDLEGLLSTYQTGRLYQEGVRVAISGPTNAGKSSLFNLFLREDRSIVSEIHGTTRDYIESWISIRGIPVSLFDTAGLRDGLGPVEKEGIRRTGEIIDAADLVLYLVDSHPGIDEEEKKSLSGDDRRGNCIPIWNKIDVSGNPAPEGFLPLSAVSGEGFQELEEAIVSHFLKGSYVGGEAIIDSQRQKECLEGALIALRLVRDGLEKGVPLDAVATDLKDALDAFGELSGEITTTEVLELMFSQFCVGK